MGKVDKDSSEFNSLNVFRETMGEFYLLHKGKVYFDESITSYNLDVLKKEGWRQIMASNSTNDFELFNVTSASGHSSKVFFTVNYLKDGFTSGNYSVFYYDWEQSYGVVGSPVEVYNSKEDNAYPVPIADANSKDGSLLSLKLYQCWNCGGHDPKTVLINLNTKEIKKLGFVKDFVWTGDGSYSFKKIVYQECNYEEDSDCIPMIGKKPIETESQKGQFDSASYNEVTVLPE